MIANTWQKEESINNNEQRQQVNITKIRIVINANESKFTLRLGKFQFY